MKIITAEAVSNLPMQVDVDAVVKFLAAVTPADSFGSVCAIHPYEENLCTARGFQRKSLDRARQFIEDNQDQNLYWEVNGLTALLDKKPNKSQIAAMHWAHLDLDEPTPEALARIRSASLPPTLIIFTGGGYGAFWRLVEPVPINGNLEQLEAINKHLIEIFGADRGTWNIDRLMRLPHTINHLSPKKRRDGRQPARTYVEEIHGERAYTAEQLGAITCVCAPKARAKEAKQPKAPGKVDRSRDLMAKVRLAVNADRSDDEVVAEYITHPHAAEQSDPKRAVRRCIEKVRTSAADFMRNDLGNAQRLVTLHGEDFRYCIETGEFHLYDGVRWVPDPQSLRMLALLKETNRGIWKEAGDAVDGEKAKALGKWAVQSQNTPKLRAAVESVKSEPGVAVHFSQFDADPMLLGVLNGVIDLRSGEFRASRREDFISKSTGCEYVKDARCPRFDRLLASMFEPAVAAYFKRVLGYIITGRTDEQCLFLLLGVAAAGKSVLIEVIKALIGEYGANMRTEVLAVQARPSKGAPSEDEARLAGRRFVSVNETSDGMRLNEALIKDLTGGDTITARELHKNSVEFVPQFKLMIRGNHKPNFDGADDGMARRVKLLWCSRTVAPSKRDPQLKAKLLKELPGILSYAVAGCLEWQRDGLQEPESVSVATRGYLDELNTLGQFIEDSCIEDEKDARVSVRGLYRCYASWAKDHGLLPWSEKRFSLKLEERGHQKIRYTVGVQFQGIRLRLAAPLDVEKEVDDGCRVEDQLEQAAADQARRKRH